MEPVSERDGFVDLQLNGYGGVDFSGADLTVVRAVEALEGALAAGLSAVAPTMITSPWERYERNLPILAEAMEAPSVAKRMLGIHLEGPFLSPAPGAIGAHCPDWVRPPDSAALGELRRLAEGRVCLVTIAADQPGADPLARAAVDGGVAVSLGHHLAGEADLARLAEAGASALTHLGNGLPNEIDRHRNPIWAGLAEDRLAATFIADGHHLPEPALKAMIRAKGVYRSIIVSDLAPIAGLPPGRYRSLGNDVELEPSGRIVNPEKRCLAGSAVPLFDAMNRLASMGFLSVEELWRLGRDNALELIGWPGSAAPPAVPAVRWNEGAGQFEREARDKG